VRCYGFTLIITRELCMFLGGCRAYEQRYISAISCCSVTRDGLGSSCRYSLIWQAQMSKTAILQVCVTLTPGTSGMEWTLEALIRCSTDAERYLTWYALFFPFSKLLFVWEISALYLHSGNGFSIQAQSKQGSLRDSCMSSSRAMSR